MGAVAGVVWGDSAFVCWYRDKRRRIHPGYHGIPKNNGGWYFRWTAVFPAHTPFRRKHGVMACDLRCKGKKRDLLYWPRIRDLVFAASDGTSREPRRLGAKHSSDC